MDAALIVVAVGDEDHGFANWLLSARFVEKLVAAGGVDCVEQSGASTRTKAVDSCLEAIEIVGPVLRDRGGYIEAHDEGSIAFGLEDREQELRGRLLLKLKARADGGTGVNDDADAQGKIDLLAK